MVILGGGRTRPQDKVDHAVGVTRLLPVGAQTRAGELLALVHARSTADAELAAAAIAAAYAIGSSRPPASKAVIRRAAASVAVRVSATWSVHAIAGVA